MTFAPGVTTNMWQYAIVSERGLRGLRMVRMDNIPEDEILLGECLPYLPGFENQPQPQPQQQQHQHQQHQQQPQQGQ
jgi:hypothetical protein